MVLFNQLNFMNHVTSTHRWRTLNFPCQPHVPRCVRSCSPMNFNEAVVLATHVLERSCFLNMRSVFPPHAATWGMMLMLRVSGRVATARLSSLCLCLCMYTFAIQPANNCREDFPNLRVWTSECFCTGDVSSPPPIPPLDRPPTSGRRTLGQRRGVFRPHPHT